MKDSDSKLRIAWFSPTADEEGGAVSSSAYVTKQVLPYLEKDFEIHCFSGGGKGMPSFCRALRFHDKQPYDVFVYQVEDSAASDFTRFHLMLVPGIVLFHDLLQRPRPVPPMLAVAGKKTERLLESLFPDGVPVDDTAGTLMRREARLAALPIFFNERNLGEYRRLAETPLVRLIGLQPDAYCLSYPAQGRIEAAQKESGDNKSLIRIGFVGACGLEFRAHKLLQALSKVTGRYELIWLLDQVEKTQAQRLAAEFGVSNVEFVSPRSFEQWELIAPRIDIAAHLFCSVYGDPGPWLSISLAAGCECLVSDFSATALLPNKIVWKIPCGEGEADALCNLLQSWSYAKGERKSGQARMYAAENFSPAVVAADLAYVVNSSAAKLKDFTTDWMRKYERIITETAASVDECII